MLIIGDTTLWFALWVIKQDARVFGDNLFFVAYTIQLAIKPARPTAPEAKDRVWFTHRFKDSPHSEVSTVVSFLRPYPRLAQQVRTSKRYYRHHQKSLVNLANVYFPQPQNSEPDPES